MFAIHIPTVFQCVVMSAFVHAVSHSLNPCQVWHINTPSIIEQAQLLFKQVSNWNLVTYMHRVCHSAYVTTELCN